MGVTTPPRRPETEHDRDLEQRVADLEALIKEARRRARRRRIAVGTTFVVVAAAVAGLGGLFGGGGGAGASAVVGDSGTRGRLNGLAGSLAPLPKGNEAQAFAFDPRRPNVVYVASADARGGVYVFKTTDGARHWRLTGARGTGWRSDILSLTADPQHPGILYAGTDTAVYKTVDGGRSWKPFRQGLFRQHKRCYTWIRATVRTQQCSELPYGTPGTPSWNRNNGWVLDVAVDPATRNVVYAAAGAVRKSVDGGRTWKAVLQPSWKSSVTRVAIAPTRPESIYAIAHGPTGATAIYKSTNAGRTWQRTGGPHANLPPSCCGDSEDALAADPGNPQTVYAAMGDTVLATTNGGASWQAMANGLPANGVTSLAVDPQSGTVYASTMVNLNRAKPNAVYPPAGALYKTTDGGQTWREIFTSIGVGKIAVDPARPSTIYAAGWTLSDKTHNDKMRILKSTNGGRTWAFSRPSADDGGRR